MTNTPLEDWSKCSDQRRYSDSYSHGLFSPKTFESGHLSTAIDDDSFPIPVSLAHWFRSRHQTDGHVLQLNGIEKWPQSIAA